MNPVKTSTSDTHEEVATAIKGVKSGKAAGEDEIRPEMLKALTGEGILVNTSVSSCVEVWQNFHRLAHKCDYSNFQEKRSPTMYKLQSQEFAKGGRGAFLEAANNIKQTWLKFLSLLIRLGRFFYEN